MQYNAYIGGLNALGIYFLPGNQNGETTFAGLWVRDRPNRDVSLLAFQIHAVRVVSKPEIQMSGTRQTGTQSQPSWGTAKQLVSQGNNSLATFCPPIRTKQFGNTFIVCTHGYTSSYAKLLLLELAL